MLIHFSPNQTNISLVCSLFYNLLNLSEHRTMHTYYVCTEFGLFLFFPWIHWNWRHNKKRNIDSNLRIVSDFITHKSVNRQTNQTLNWNLMHDQLGALLPALCLNLFGFFVVCMCDFWIGWIFERRNNELNIILLYWPFCFTSHLVEHISEIDVLTNSSNNNTPKSNIFHSFFGKKLISI